MLRWQFLVFLLLAACGDDVAGGDAGSAAEVVIDAPATVQVVEGSTARFMVKLTTDPRRDVVIDVRSQDPGVASVREQTITLSSANFASGAAVDVLGTQDDGDIINEETDIELLVDGVVAQRVAATVVDNDLQQIVVDPPTLALTEGVTASFDVWLTREPGEPVTFDVKSSAASVVTGAPATLTFTPASYATKQTVTVTSLPDADMVDDTAQILVGDGSLVQTTAIVTVHDDDTQALVLSPSAVSIVEGGTASFTVALAYQPATPVYLYVQSSNSTNLGVQITDSLMFTSSNYSVPRTLNLTAFEDSDQTDNSYAVTFSGGVAGSVPVAVTDNDQLVVPSQLFVDEGQSTTLIVRLSQDPGPNGRTVDVQAVSGDVSVTNGTLTFTSANYATGLPVTINGLVDAYSTSSKQGLLRVSSADQTSRDVSVTVNQRIPGPISASLYHNNSIAAGDIVPMTLSVQPSMPWPGDGQLELDLPAGYDESGTTLSGSSLDGSLSLVVTPSKLVITRANGSPSTQATLQFANWRNPTVSGSYNIPIVVRSAAAVPIDQGTASEYITEGQLAGASMTVADTQAGATGDVTFTFTTKNPWPADGRFAIDSSRFDFSNATVTVQSNVDGTFTKYPYSSGVFVRSGGTTVPGGTTVSITFANVTNPATSQDTESFYIHMMAATGGIDTALVQAPVIGCPSALFRRPRHVYSVPFGGVPWQWGPLPVEWGYPATATAAGDTDLLVVDDYRFAMPVGAVITGIEVDIEHDVAQGSNLVDSAIRLVKGGTIGTTDKSSTAPWVWFTPVTYGGPTDLWGDTWTAADITSTTFGVAIAATSGTPGMTWDAGVGDVLVTVHVTCQ